MGFLETLGLFFLAAVGSLTVPAFLFMVVAYLTWHLGKPNWIQKLASKCIFKPLALISGWFGIK